MCELYWITRLDNILAFFAVIIMFSTIVLIISLFAFGYDHQGDLDFKNRAKKGVVSSLSTLVMSVLVLVFLPSTKEMLLIYGVGGTIDYIKCNNTAKGLPDKAVKALDKYLDELSKDKQDEKDNVQR